MSFPFSSIDIPASTGVISFYADDNEPYRKVNTVMVDCCTPDYNAVSLQPTGTFKFFPETAKPKVVIDDNSIEINGAILGIKLHLSDDFNRESMGTEASMFMGPNVDGDDDNYDNVGSYIIRNNKAVKSASANPVGLHKVVYGDAIAVVNAGFAHTRTMSAHISINSNSTPFSVGFLMGTSGTSTGSSYGYRATLDVSGNTLTESIYVNNILANSNVSDFTPVGDFYMRVREESQNFELFVFKNGVSEYLGISSGLGSSFGSGVAIYSTDPSGFSSIDNYAVYSSITSV